MLMTFDQQVISTIEKSVKNYAWKPGADTQKLISCALTRKK